MKFWLLVWQVRKAREPYSNMVCIRPDSPAAVATHTRVAKHRFQGPLTGIHRIVHVIIYELQVRKLPAREREIWCEYIIGHV